MKDFILKFSLNILIYLTILSVIVGIVGIAMGMNSFIPGSIAALIVRMLFCIYFALSRPIIK